MSLRAHGLPHVAPLRPRELRSAGEDVVTEQARDGSDAAFGELYRRHVAVARRTARYILRDNNDAEDVVADAFTGVLSALRGGAGPRDENFRAYLLSCVRNGCAMRSRQRGRSVPVDPTDFENSADVLEDSERFADADVITKAYSSLPAPWQRVLWMTEVEDRALDDVATNLQLRKPAAAALSYRAHEGLTEAYLTQAIRNRVGAASGGDRGCTTVEPQLARYVRGRCRPGTRRTIRSHLDGCTPCSVLVVELGDVNHHLRGLMIAPLALGAFLLEQSKAHGAAASAGSAAVVSRAATAFGARSLRHAWVLPAQVAGAVTLGVLTIAPESGRTAATTRAITTAGAADAVDAAVIDAGPAGGSTAVPATVEVGAPVVGTAAGPTTTAVEAATSIANGSSAESTVVPTTVVAASEAATTVPVVTVTSDVAVPVSSVPTTTTPAVPLITLPSVTLPEITVPAIAVPPIAVPPIAVPPIAVPPITTPPLTLPAITVPPIVTVPAVVSPVVTAPLVVPPVTVPVTIPPPVVGSGRPGVDLRSATSFAVLANTAVTSTGASSISGDVGVSGGLVTGLAPTQLVGGSLASALGSIDAQASVATASLDIAGLVAAPLAGVELGGTTRGPGTYSSGTLGMTGTLVLDGGGDPNARFVFEAATTLITGSASHVVLVNGAQPCNVFWKVGTSATLGTFSTLAGTIIAEVSITATTGVSVDGRLIARGGAVTLDTNTIRTPTCG